MQTFPTEQRLGLIMRAVKPLVQDQVEFSLCQSAAQRLALADNQLHVNLRVPIAERRQQGCQRRQRRLLRGAEPHRALQG